jgi:hypothetical protein
MAHQAGICGVTSVGTVRNYGYRGQQTGQGSHRGGFSGSALAPDEDTTNVRINQAQDQGLLHLLLSDYGSKRKYGGRKFHGHIFLAKYVKRKKYFYSVSLKISGFS